MKYLTKYLKKLKQFRTLTKQDSIPGNSTINPDVEGLYEIVSLPEKPEAWCVKLIATDWKGVVYTYSRVSLNPNGDQLKCSVEYDVLWVPEEIRKMEMPDERRIEFETMLGKIAMNILYKNSDALVEDDEEDEKLVIKDVK